VRAWESVTGWDVRSGEVRVTTDRGAYAGGRLVIAAGAWLGKLVPGLDGLAVAERQVLAWLQPSRPDLFRPERFPVFNCLVDEGRYYGFPVFGIPGFKFGRYHHREERVDPDRMERAPNREDEALLRRFAERYFPDGAGPTMSLKTCIFTNTPDEHFLIDRLPDAPEVVIASPCSGHGFKFASVVGEILADVATQGSTAHDISLFTLGRFTHAGA
jgi:sarcosine oxidase